MKIKIILLTIFLGNLIFFITPQTSTLAQATCPSDNNNHIRIEDGLLTTLDSIEANVNFFTTNLCITEERASIPQFALPTYEKMKSLYFDQLKANSSLYIKETILGDANQGDIQTVLNRSHGSGDKDTIIRIAKNNSGGEGSLTISNSYNPNFTKPIVIFVDGDLSLNNNIPFGANNLDRGLVFIVKGKIKIDKNITQINAFLINFGEFCSAWEGSNCLSLLDDASPLIINGSVVSLPENAADKPKFVRSLADNSEAAEKIVYQPKYLVILKDIFSRDLTIWKEIQ